MTPSTFPILILNARPAAGKSEIIDYLQRIPRIDRQNRFHMGQLEVFDDFPILWSWFEEDAILEDMGKTRLHTDAQDYFTGNHLWNVLIQRMCLEYSKKVRDNTKYHYSHTALIEFSRGTEHGGYKTAYQHLSQAVLSSAVVLYVDVSWEESLRKNRKRFNPKRPDSILEHALDDEKMFRLYRHDDWDEVHDGDPVYLHIKGQKVPYAILSNHDDITTERGPALGKRLEEILHKLWGVYSLVHT